MPTAQITPKRAAKKTSLFEQSFAKLNSAQKQAVDTIEGPVMVIAGPGTGKTETVAMRVANILRKTQMKPSNILCLTFSKSGAKAMRERLRKIIGPDAYGVTVDTVHSFCNEIILQHPHLFEDFQALEQVSEIERLRIVKGLMKELGAGSVLGKPSLENDRASAVLSRISEMKREGISVDYLRKLVPDYQAEIETTKSGKQRDQNVQAFKDDLRKVKQYTEFITLYQGYNEELTQSHRYDYEDMILVTLQALTKHDWLLANVQERYQYVLVDEYQDLNGAQNRVIELLTQNPIEGEESNVFVVGDDDQAIYRFQGASIMNMLQFSEKHPKAAIISLTENYRSTQTILDAASNVIEENEERLVNKIEDASKNLSAVTRTEKEKPTFLRYPAIENERAGITEILTQAHADGIPWNEMSILCRRNEELEELFDALQTAEIPVVLTAKQDLMLHSEVRQAIHLLRAIEHMNSDAVLSIALSCPTLSCTPADLGRLWCTFRKQKREEAISLREFLLACGDELPESIKSAYNLLEALSAEKDAIILPELLEKLLKQSHLLPKKSDTTADPRVIAGLHAFYNYVKGRVYENKALTITILLSDLDEYLTERHLKLEYAVPHLVSDGVNLMTAHGAKGLEFELVVIAHTRFRNWGNRIRGSLLSLPDHLIFGLEKEIEKQAKQEDERRLMYVAMTRAKRHLLMTFGETYRSGEDIRAAEPSSFLAEAGETVTEVTISAGEVPAPIDTLHKPELDLDATFKAFLEERLEDYSLSVTALNAFIKDPQEFLWVHLLQQPQAKASHLSFGTVMHAALERRNLAWQAGEAFETEDLITTFQKVLNEREVFTETERAHYLHAGEKTLREYGEDTASDQPIILSTERAITARYLEIPLFGKVDRIDLFQKDGQDCRVIDYKTGQPKKTEAAVRKDENLFRQLVFYKLLTDLSPSFTHTATLFTLDFVGNEKEGRRVIDLEITEEEVKELKALIKKVWQKIIALDFTTI